MNAKQLLEVVDLHGMEAGHEALEAVAGVDVPLDGWHMVPRPSERAGKGRVPATGVPLDPYGTEEVGPVEDFQPDERRELLLVSRTDDPDELERMMGSEFPSVQKAVQTKIKSMGEL